MADINLKIVLNSTSSILKSLNQIEDNLSKKVDKEVGKGLSSNDYTADEKAEVEKIKRAISYEKQNVSGADKIQANLNISSLHSDASDFILSENKVFSERLYWINSGYINAISHLVTYNIDYVYSELIPILPGSVLRCTDFQGTSSVSKVDIFDKGKNIIFSKITDEENFIIEVLKGSRYVRFCDMASSGAKVEIIRSFGSRISNVENNSAIEILDCRPTLFENLNTLNKSIKSIFVKNADLTKKYGMASVQNKNTDTTIRIFNSDKVEISRFMPPTFPQRGIKEVVFEPINNSGVEIKAIIDFDLLSDFAIDNNYTDKSYFKSWCFDQKEYSKSSIAQEIINRDNLTKQQLDIEAEKLLCVTSSEFLNVGYINHNTNKYSANSQYCYSKKYPVVPAQELYLINFQGTSSADKCRFFDKNDILLLDSKLCTDSSALLRVTAPSNARYVEFCCQSVDDAGNEIFPKSKVVFNKIKKSRLGKNILTLKDFRKTDTTVENGKTKIIGTDNWEEYLLCDISFLLEKCSHGVSFTLSAFGGSSNNFLLRLSRISNDAASIEIDKTNFRIIGKLYQEQEAVVYESAHEVTFTQGASYSLVVEKDTNGSVLKIISEGFEKVHTLSNITPDGYAFTAAQQLGKMILSVKSGTFIINDMFLKSNYENPEIFIKGDSLVEGNTFAALGLGIENRWAYKLAKESGLTNVAISAIGGLALEERTLVNMVYENDYFRSKYYVVELVTNNYKFGFEYYKNLLDVWISYLKFNGQIPVLVTVCPRPAPTGQEQSFADFRAAANKYVRESGELYIDINKALTTEENNWKPGVVLSDEVHYSVAGHQLAFERVKIDVPELI